MPKLTKRDVKSLLSEVGEVCGREKRPTEPILDYLEFLVSSCVELPEDEWKSLSMSSRKLIEKFLDVRNLSSNYRNKWTVILKKFGFIFAEKNSKNAAERRSENENRKGKPAGVRLMEIMLEQGLETSEGKLILKLQSEGYQYSKSTAHTIRSAFRQAVVVLADSGYLSRMPKP